MTARIFLLRLAAGLGILLLTLIVSFAVAMSQFPRWGATAAETRLALPGDELAQHPLINWTNAININARPEQVWPWIAQLGDTRGGFYSYTFIEDRVGALMGEGGYTVDYQNADRIMPQWQSPAPGDMLVQGILKVREVKAGQYLLADSITPETMQWVWVWRLLPLEGGEHTRLIVRFLIQLPSGGENPVLTTVMKIGGFVMQQRMMHGFRLRAEGGVEPAYMETMEIALWLTTLLIGLAGAVLFLLQREWRRPLTLAVVSVVALVALTFIQPEVWVRFVVNVALLLGVWWAYQPQIRLGPVLRPQPAAR
jgi:hypothetical protein